MRTGTFSQIYIQIIFAVKGRKSLLHENWEINLYKYITGIVQKKEQKMLAINGVPDHIHFFIGMRPSCKLSDLVREVKKSSNTYINDNGFTAQKFEWQNGYGAFSYSRSSLDNVIGYIQRQKEHHQKVPIQKEYEHILKRFGIEYRDEYLFDWLDDV